MVTYDVLDIHTKDSEVHFVTQVDGDDVVEELIYDVEDKQVILVNYPNKVFIVFPKVTTTKVEQWRAM